MVLVQYLTVMEIHKFPNISYEHPRGSAFRKYRAQTLAPDWFTYPNSNHRAYQQERKRLSYVTLHHDLSMKGSRLVWVR